MGRDHSVECDVCGYARGGMNDLMCDCDIDADLERMQAAERLRTLAHNLAIAAGLCAAHRLGRIEMQSWHDQWGGSDPRSAWRPGCGRSAPGWVP